MKNIRTISTFFLICVVLLIYLVPKQLLFNSNQSLCVCKLFFGCDCPGCGLTRALFLFLHQDFLNAIRLNLGIVVLVPIIIVEIIVSIISNNLKLLKFRKALYILFPLVLFINYSIKCYLFFN